MNLSVQFAKNLGVKPEKGVHHCFLTGQFCDEQYPAKKYTSSNFTDIYAHSAGGKYMSNLTVSTMGEKADIELFDGEKRSKQKIRNYSWLVTNKKNIAFLPRHKKEILEHVKKIKSNYGICISTDGQKHYLYRCKITKNPNPSFFYNGQEVKLNVFELLDHVKVFEKIIRHSGKKSLDGVVHYDPEVSNVNSFHNALLGYLRLRPKLKRNLYEIILYFCRSKEKLLEVKNEKN